MPDFQPTSEQASILNHTRKRHGRILAGPGTGKSTTMVALLRRLMETEPDTRLKMLTFTRAATRELAQKISDESASVPPPSTVHSFAISVLLRNPGTGGFPEPLRIPDTWESKRIIKPNLARMCGVNAKTLDKLIQEMAANWQALQDILNPEISDDQRLRFRGAWAVHREVYGYTLLQELPYALNRALEEHSDLDGLDYDLILVDEYQDLNACDLSILKQISQQRNCSIVATGDDDQSIYSWRNAAPEGIRRFPTDYAPNDDYPLSVTMRCARSIIDWANYVIAQDADRLGGRTPLSCSESAPEGEVALLSFADNEEEARGIAMLAGHLIAYRGVQPSDILILTRSDFNRSFSRPIREELNVLGIETYDPNYVVELMADARNRELLEFLRLLTRPDDPLSWAALLTLTLGIGDSFINGIFERAKQARSSFGEQLLSEYEDGFPYAPARLMSLAVDRIRSILDWAQSRVAPDQKPEGGWVNYIDSLVANSIVPAATEKFREVMAELDRDSESDQSMAQFLSQVEPFGKDMAQARSNGIRIMTMGGAKGLTVKATIVAGAENGLVPRQEGILAEERRILYVAMTRSREYLYCTWARRRTGPTARAGGGGRARRLYSSFLENGPVRSQDGMAYLARMDDQQLE